jgi:hypothetical protein
MSRPVPWRLRYAEEPAMLLVTPKEHSLDLGAPDASVTIFLPD